MLGLGIALGAPIIDRTGTLQVSKYLVTSQTTDFSSIHETQTIRYNICKEFEKYIGQPRCDYPGLLKHIKDKGVSL